MALGSFNHFPELSVSSSGFWHKLAALGWFISPSEPRVRRRLDIKRRGRASRAIVAWLRLGNWTPSALAEYRIELRSYIHFRDWRRLNGLCWSVSWLKPGRPAATMRNHWLGHLTPSTLDPAPSVLCSYTSVVVGWLQLRACKMRGYTSAPPRIRPFLAKPSPYKELISLFFETSTPSLQAYLPSSSYVMRRKNGPSVSLQKCC